MSSCAVNKMDAGCATSVAIIPNHAQRVIILATLNEILLDPARRPQAVDALSAVVNDEVKAKSGISGAAIKTAFGAATKVDSSIVHKAIDKMLPDFAAKLEPYWAAKGDQPFGTHLAGQSDAVANSLLEVTDQRAADPDNAALSKAYGMLRGKAKDNVVAALPRLGAAIEGLAV